MDTMAICPGSMTDKIRSDLFVQTDGSRQAGTGEVGLPQKISSEYEHFWVGKIICSDGRFQAGTGEVGLHSPLPAGR